MTSSAFRVSAFEIPTDAPESDGTLEWTKTVLVTVEMTQSGQTGLGYTYADVATAKFADVHLSDIAAAADPMAVGATFDAMGRAVRNLGRDGVAAMAIAAVDMACWDLKARLLSVPLVRLLGARRGSIPAYGSGGFTSYSVGTLCRQLSIWKEQGFSRVKMKIGADPNTPERVRAAREAVGDHVEVFVDANGAFARKTALAMAERLAGLGVTWFEEPVSSDDLEGLRFVRERVAPGMQVAAGEYGYRSGYFERMIASGAVDVLQADATRCGVSGFLAADALCDAAHVPISAHCAPSIHAHLGCAARRALHVEYFHDHARIELALFEGAILPSGGTLSPDLSAPGIGVALKRRDAECYLVFDAGAGR